MAVEVASYISQLNKSYPRNRDLIKEGDDHIRLIKGVLQNTFPGIDSTVTFTSAKLNKLDKTLVYEEDTLNINSPLKMAAEKGMDFGGNQVKNVGNPTEAGDAVNLASLQGSLVWPVGSIFMSLDARNPVEYLGFGTWEKFAAGRVIVGTGATTDEAGEAANIVNEQAGGRFNMVLAEANLPAHSHWIELGTNHVGDHQHDNGLAMRSDGYSMPFGYVPQSGSFSFEHHQYNSTGRAYTSVGGGHSHHTSGATHTAGSGAGFTNMQPWIGVNIWVRRPDPEQ